MKFIDLKEFVEEGYLQEVNRQFLHRLGLALVIHVDDVTGKYTLEGVADGREDPEGFIFDLNDEKAISRLERANNIMCELNEKSEIRIKSYGFDIQPIEYAIGLKQRGN